MFGNKLKQLRKKRGLTQQQLAEELGFDRTTITKYEAQENCPPVDACKKICDFFDVSMDYMMNTLQDGKFAAALDERVLILQRAAIENSLSPQELQDILDYAMYRYPQKFRGLEPKGENKRKK